MKFNEHFGAISLIIQDFIDQYNDLRARKQFIPRSLQENNTFATSFLGHQLQARKESQKEYKEPNELLLLRKEVEAFRDSLKLEDEYSKAFEGKLTDFINNITAFDNIFSKIQDRLWAYYLGKFGQGGWKAEALQIILNLDRWESENRFPNRENELLDGNVLRYEKRIHEFKLKLEKEMEAIKPGFYLGVISYNEGELKKELEMLKNEIPTQNFLQLRRHGVESFRRDWIKQSYIGSIRGILAQYKVMQEQIDKTIQMLSVGENFLDIKKVFENQLEKKEDLDPALKQALQKLLAEFPSEEFEALSDPVLSRLAPALKIDPLLSSGFFSPIEEEGNVQSEKKEVQEREFQLAERKVQSEKREVQEREVQLEERKVQSEKRETLEDSKIEVKKHETQSAESEAQLKKSETSEDSEIQLKRHGIQSEESLALSAKSEVQPSAASREPKADEKVKKLAKEIEKLRTDNGALREVNEVLIKKQVSLTPTYSASSLSSSVSGKGAANNPSPSVPVREKTGKGVAKK